MKTIDYAPIAKTYDSLPIRNALEPDPVLQERLAARAANAPFAIADIGCGTGTWLAAQIAAFAARGVSFTGVDPSDAMLAIARRKCDGAKFTIARAEALPFATESLEFAACRFAFHHVVEKPRALDEVQRVLAPDAPFLVVNVVPELMPDWWVFKFFPEAAGENARYWSPERLEESLRMRAFDVVTDVQRTRGEIALSEALEQARVRDQSHLAAIDDAAYAARLRDLEKLCEKDPKGKVATETAIMTMRATRR